MRILNISPRPILQTLFVMAQLPPWINWRDLSTCFRNYPGAASRQRIDSFYVWWDFHHFSPSFGHLPIRPHQPALLLSYNSYTSIENASHAGRSITGQHSEENTICSLLEKLTFSWLVPHYNREIMPYLLSRIFRTRKTQGAHVTSDRLSGIRRRRFYILLSEGNVPDLQILNSYRQREMHPHRNPKIYSGT